MGSRDFMPQTVGPPLDTAKPASLLVPPPSPRLLGSPISQSQPQVLSAEFNPLAPRVLAVSEMRLRCYGISALHLDTSSPQSSPQLSRTDLDPTSSLTLYRNAIQHMGLVVGDNDVRLRRFEPLYAYLNHGRSASTQDMTSIAQS